jgi:hypothetical protein
LARFDCPTLGLGFTGRAAACDFGARLRFICFGGLTGRIECLTHLLAPEIGEKYLKKWYLIPGVGHHMHDTDGALNAEF